MRSRLRCGLVSLVALLPCFSAAAAPPAALVPPAPPQELFAELFPAVQLAQVFADGKTFADAVPRVAPRDILFAYRQTQPVTRAELAAFVAAHFDLPEDTPAAEVVARESLPIGQHIDRLWNALTRSTPSTPEYSSLLVLPQPFVVPGGRFREMYYWDSYFTLLGLAQSGRRDLLESMVRDFAYLIDTFGHIPNGTRSYYLSRSQPPFFYLMVGLLTPDDPARAYASYLPQLEREYAFWMDGAPQVRPGAARRRVVRLSDGSLLNRFYDDRATPRDESYREDTELAKLAGGNAGRLFRNIRAAAESGWDFSSRWFADGRSRATLMTTELVPVDLNSLLFGLEEAIALGCARRGEALCDADFRRRAAARRAAVDRYLWDEAAGAYLDYRYTQRTRIQRLSAATLYPLFTGMAASSQAVRVAAGVRRQLLVAGGIVATPRTTGEQWDSPNGWAPLQWIAVDGLRRYGQADLARSIACRWMLGVTRLYAQSAKLVEKYDVVDTGRQGGGGEYPLQDGFGWTNGVMRQFMSLYSTSCGQPDKPSS